MNITRRIEIERRIAIIRVLQELINICEQRLQIRRWWVRPHLSVHLRETYGAYHSIFKYFKLEDHEEFYRFIGMTVAQFEVIYELVKDSLTKYSNRGCLPSELRLAAVLNYLVHGNKIKQSSWLFRIGKSTMYKIVPEVCQALFTVLRDTYLKFPDEDDWLDIAENFQNIWNMPNCVGSIDVNISHKQHSGQVGKKLQSLFIRRMNFTMVYETIIEAIRQKPFLYDKSSQDYKNIDLKRETFEEIATMISEKFDIQMSGVNIQGIWEDLHKEFKRELKEISHKPSGAANQKIITSPYFKNLLFLQNHINQYREAFTSLKESKNVSFEKNLSTDYPKRKPVSIWKNKELCLQQQQSTVIKSPTWDDYIVKKTELANEDIKRSLSQLQEITAIEYNNVQQLASHNMASSSASSASSSPNTDYLQIFQEKFCQIDESERDDCLIEIIAMIEELKNSSNSKKNE